MKNKHKKSRGRKNKKRVGNSKFVAYDHLDKIGEIAIYYGFTPMKNPSISRQDIEKSKDLMEGDYVDDETDKHSKLPLHAEEKIALIRTYYEMKMNELPQPVLLYFKDPQRGSTKNGVYHRYADLEILGTSGPIAEATLIQTAKSMLEEEGYKNTIVEINSIGDKDSMARFARELTAYYRKNINDMSSKCRQMLKKDPFELLSSKDESAAELNSKAPKSMDFLSENSRRHLEEVLEYLESLGISYVINNGLIGNRKYCTETIFSIIKSPDEGNNKNSKDQKVLAVGVRYNGLAKKLNMKKDTQGVGISLLIKNGKGNLRKTLKKVKRPIASFIQLGIESKLLSLEIIEKLRRVKIPLYLSLAKDRLGAQVTSVEKHHTPFTIVMGKKEAVEKTAIVRNTDTHSQDIVSLDDLAKYMKKIEGKVKRG